MLVCFIFLRVLGPNFVCFIFFSACLKTEFCSLCASYFYFWYYCDTVVSELGIKFLSALVLAMIAKNGVIVITE